MSVPTVSAGKGTKKCRPKNDPRSLRRSFKRLRSSPVEMNKKSEIQNSNIIATEPVAVVTSEEPPEQKRIGDDVISSKSLPEYNESMIVDSDDQHGERTTVPVTEPETPNDEDIEILIPPKDVCDKIIFIINNINLENAKKKCEEVKKLLHCDFLPWFANYLVTKRVIHGIELHSLYDFCTTCFNSRPFDDLVVKETIRVIKTLLWIKKTPMVKTSLRSLGHWLGLMTLGRDRPLPIRLKQWLIDTLSFGYSFGHLLCVVEFVGSILESCVRSTIFDAQSLWTLSILNCLAQLHQRRGCAPVIQLEIERLCKKLNVDLQVLPGYIARRRKEAEIELARHSNVCVPVFLCETRGKCIEENHHIS